MSDDATQPNIAPGGYDSAAVHRAPDLLDTTPSTIGPYRILETIGTGGMGVVYRARQDSPIKREVVLKLIKLGMDTKAVIARFEAERQALAMMNHPHIAKVFDAGTDETGRPYFVMEYVKGQPITTHADTQKLTLNERLVLHQQVCEAIQHAHHKGVVHRDLKPSNVLVFTQDGKPFAKVIDFGIAKAMNQQLTDKTLFTQHHQMIGTPEYMSPEQADGNIDIDTRTDVYSLGVLLYELLTGQTPFDARRLRSAAYDAMVRIIREEEPPKPSVRLSTLAGSIGSTPILLRDDANDAARQPSQSELPLESSVTTNTLATLARSRSTDEKQFQKQIRGELDWLVMKSMDKDRSRRYATPTDLSQDIERYLTGTPIIAAPPSWGYRARKLLRKNKSLAISSAAVLSALLIGLGATTWQWRVSRQNYALALVEKSRAESERLKAERLREEAIKSRRIAESTGDFMLAILSTNEGNYADQVTVLSAINTASAVLQQRFGDQPLQLASARSAIGRSYSRIGKYDRAYQLLAEALPVLTNELGSHDRLTRVTQLDLSTICLVRGDVAEARKLVEAVLLAGPEDLPTGDYLRACRKLSQINGREGNYAEARRIAETTLSQHNIVARNISKLSDVPAAAQQMEIMHLLSQVADCDYHEGRPAEAERLLKATAEYMAVGNIVQMAWTQADLGRARLAQGDIDGALAYFSKSLPVMQRRFGNTHFRTAELLSDIDRANIARERGRWATTTQPAMQPTTQP